MENFNTNNTQTTENQEVIYINETKKPFTIYCSHLGYIKGFNRVIDAFDYVSVWSKGVDEMTQTWGVLEGFDLKKVEIEIIEHLIEHGYKRDNIICKFKVSDLVKSKY